MGVDFDELELRLMREFLERASATEWLVTALATNYDGKSELIAWMAAHPKLDRATAAALYWYSQPGYYQRFRSEADVPSVNRAGWANVHVLQDRVVSGTVAAPVRRSTRRTISRLRPGIRSNPARTGRRKRWAHKTIRDG